MPTHGCVLSNVTRQLLAGIVADFKREPWDKKLHVVDHAPSRLMRQPDRLEPTVNNCSLQLLAQIIPEFEPLQLGRHDSIGAVGVRNEFPALPRVSRYAFGDAARHQQKSGAGEVQVPAPILFRAYRSQPLPPYPVLEKRLT